MLSLRRMQVLADGPMKCFLYTVGMLGKSFENPTVKSNINGLERRMRDINEMNLQVPRRNKLSHVVVVPNKRLAVENDSSDAGSGARVRLKLPDLDWQ